MRKKEILLALIQHYADGNKAQFAKMVGVSPQAISTWLARDTFDADKIFAFCEGINGDWLLSGKGNMLKSPQPQLIPTTDGSGLPLIPVDAMAGTLQGEQEYNPHEVERYTVPGMRNADYLITVHGDSMQPKYYAGDIVACRNLSLNDIFFQWGRVYVLDTEQGALIKRVEQGKNDDTIMLVSDNERYKPFYISKVSIRHIALVVGHIHPE